MFLKKATDASFQMDTTSVFNLTVITAVCVLGHYHTIQGCNIQHIVLQQN